MRRIIWLFFLSLFLIFIGRVGGGFSGLRTFFSSKFDIPRSSAWRLNKVLTREWQFWLDLRQLYSEKIALEERLSSVEGQFAQEKEKLRLCALIEKQLSFFPQDNFSVILARVVGREGDFSLRLNRGEKDGVGVGDLVLYANNFVGTIYEVNSQRSLVKLLISPETILEGINQTSSDRARGLVRGNFGLTLVMENFLPAADVKKGDLIISYFELSPHAPEMPLLIGKVESLELGPDGLIKKAYVRSQVDLLTLEEVFVLKNKDL
ncbi:MAG: rod shape-determining protein MreC [bacterium]|nr:rod shape-determining protein MreC [bacterium]